MTMPASSPVHAPPPYPRRWWALLVLCLALAVINMDKPLYGVDRDLTGRSRASPEAASRSKRNYKR